MSGNGRRIIYHNELYFRVQRPVKRRLMEIAKEKGVRPDEILSEITTKYVMDNTPHDTINKTVKKVNNWFERNHKPLYTIYIAILFMMIGGIFILSMSRLTESMLFVAFFFIFVIIILVFAKIFHIMSKER